MRVLRYNGELIFDTDYPDPVPGENECLIRVRLAGISAADLRIVRGGFRFRGVLGHEMVGVVERGPDKWRGRRIVCEISCVCRDCDMCLAGLSNHCRRRTVMGMSDRDGCFADRVVMPARNLHAVPDALADDEAVFVEPLAGAYQILVQCPIERRMRVSVVGPGRVGLLAAQVLRSTGCKLTVVGRNPVELDMCDKKGIQSLRLDEFVPRQDRDVVVECTGSAEGLRIAAALVRPRGTIIIKNSCACAVGVPSAARDPVDPGALGEPTASPGANDSVSTSSGCADAARCSDLAPLVTNEVTLIGSRCGPFPEAIAALARSAVDVRSMISRVFDLDDAVAAMTHASRPHNIKTLIRVSR